MNFGEYIFSIAEEKVKGAIFSVNVFVFSQLLNVFKSHNQQFVCDFL
jgi:hypothetical protein